MIMSKLHHNTVRAAHRQLTEAADLIEERGWVREVEPTANGVRRVTLLEALEESKRSEDSHSLAVNYLTAVLEGLAPLRWAQHRAKSKKQVSSRLRAAAKALAKDHSNYLPA